MKVSTRVRYGLKALSYIAENTGENKLVRIKEISEAQKISVQYLEQILYRLKNNKIIEGKRGPNGGYKLNVVPSEITLHTLYIILDEDERIIDCNEVKDSSCATHECEDDCIWHKLNRAMIEILENITLEQYINNHDII